MYAATSKTLTGFGTVPLSKLSRTVVLSLVILIIGHFPGGFKVSMPLKRWIVALLLVVLASCGDTVEPTQIPTSTPTPTPTATATPTPAPTATPAPLAQLCDPATSLVEAVLADEDVVKVLEAFLETEPENFVPLLPEDKQDLANASITAARLAVQAGKLLNQLPPEAKEKLVETVEELCR